MTLVLPPEIGPHIQEVLEALIDKAASGFTGSVTLEFKQGIPMSLKVTEVQHVGRRRKREGLTGET